MNREEVIRIFSVKIRKILRKQEEHLEEWEEIRLRTGQPLEVICRGKRIYLSEDGETSGWETAYRVRGEDVRETLEYISRYSLYAFSEEVRQGFLTIPGRSPGRCGRSCDPGAGWRPGDISDRLPKYPPGTPDLRSGGRSTSVSMGRSPVRAYADSVTAGSGENDAVKRYHSTDFKWLPHGAAAYRRRSGRALGDCGMLWRRTAE